MSATFYVTTPIYYVNDVPHIGHCYTTFAADTLARWHRLAGEDVYFLTGTDEHGQKIEKAARAAGISPEAHADKYANRFRALWSKMGISNDDFIRTTESRHEAVVRAVWNRLEAAGDIYLGKYEGWYSVGDEGYFADSEIVDGRAPSGHEVSWVEESSYFFRLSKYGPRLLEHLRAHPEFVRPETRYNEIVRFIESGLQDVSISRATFSWGVPVPGDSGHVMYVWLDALTNYISALGGPGETLYDRFWPNVIHLIGKDILRFHAVYWPCFLMSAGLPLPRQIFAHGWWTIEGRKMSKTLGNVVDPVAVADQYGLDEFRYFLLREVTFGSDGDYSERALRNRINGDLANDYGNLLNRALNMVHRYLDGIVPARGESAEPDEALFTIYTAARDALLPAMDAVSFNRALNAIWSLVRHGNKYVDTCAPWALKREGREERLREVLYNVCEALRIVGIWTLPFLPGKASELLDRLGVAPEARMLEHANEWGGLEPGVSTRIGDPLFPRLDDRAQAEASNTPSSAQKKQAKPSKKSVKKSSDAPALPPGIISYEDFARLDLRVARIVTAKKHPDADRLVVLSVDAGEAEPRTLCAGIAEAYAPESLVGLTVVLLANLKPRKVRGILSQGMLLAAGGGEQPVRLLTVPGEMPTGVEIS